MKDQGRTFEVVSTDPLKIGICVMSTAGFAPEGTGWNKGGSVAWQVFDNQGRPEAGGSGRAEGLPAWDAPAAFAGPDDSFRIVF